MQFEKFLSNDLLYVTRTSFGFKAFKDWKQNWKQNFAKFTRKYLCQSLFLNKVAQETLAQVFSCEFCEISKNTFFKRRLLVAPSKEYLSNV